MLFAQWGGSVQLMAQTDVTSTYLSNADFETDVTGIATNDKIYDVPGWTETPAAGSKSYYKLGTINYETSASASLGFTSPSNGSSVTEGNNALLGVKLHWANGSTIGVSQTATLPAGLYTLTYDTYVQQTLDNASSICGITIGGTSTYDVLALSVNTWMNHSQSFVITEDTEVTFSFGYKKTKNVGGDTSPVLYVDNVKLTRYEIGTSLVNADFETDDNIAVGVVTYDYDAANNGTSFSGLQPVTGWYFPTNGNARSGATYTYGGGSFLGGTAYTAPEVGASDGDTKALGLLSVWSGQAQYIQPVTLPAGAYELSFNVYNAGGTGSLSNNLMGVTVGSTNYYATNNSYAENTWTAERVSFSLKEETTCIFSAGVVFGGGGGSAPHLFVDAFNLTKLAVDKVELEAAIDNATSIDGVIDDEGLTNALTAANTLYDDAAATQEQVDAAVVALNSAISSALASDSNKTNIPTTLFVSSPSFEDGKGNWQWYSANDTGIKENINQYVTEGIDGAYLFNTWDESTTEKYVKQTLTNLPTGYYTLTGSFASDANVTATLYAGAESVTATGIVKERFVDYTTAPVKVEDGTLEIGIKSTSWYKVDNFRLTYYTVEGGEAIMDEAKAAVAAANLKGAKAKLTVVINAAKAITLTYGTAAFQKPIVEEVNYTAMQSAISVAEDAVANATELEAVTVAKDALAQAVEKVKTTTFNAPGSDEVFNIRERVDDWRHDGSPLTLKVNSDGNGGGQFFDGATINANYAQQWTLTIVNEAEGTYTLSSVEADGTRYYICTGVVYGGNASQVRTTSDAAKAMVIKIEPTDYTCTVFKLKNTEANQYLGDQDNKATGGFFTVDSHSTFTITPATKPVVDVTVKAGKFAGRIFPFKPELTLPEGVKAYTCAGVVDGVLTLDEVTDGLVANTPYLLENTTAADYITSQTGFGAAYQLDYAEGELMGTYASEGYLTQGYYVLQTLNDKQAFYLVDAADKFPCQPYRVQLKAQTNGVRCIGFPGTTDAINSLLSGDAATTAIYDMNGVRRNGLQKGVNIIRLSDGKTQKVIVK